MSAFFDRYRAGSGGSSRIQSVTDINSEAENEFGVLPNRGRWFGTDASRREHVPAAGKGPLR